MYEKDWDKQNPPVRQTHRAPHQERGSTTERENGEAKPIYDFYINMDNLYLKTEIKPARADPRLIHARFTYGMVLLGLALVQQGEVEKGESQNEEVRRRGGRGREG